MVHMIRADYDEALAWATRALASGPNFLPSLWVAIAATAHLGRMDEAHRFLETLRRITPGVTIASLKALEQYQRSFAICGDPRRAAARRTQ